MFSATEFTYAGVYSGLYGLKIAKFNGSSLEETPYITPTIVTSKPAKSKCFYYENTTYDSPPTVDFSIICSEPISDILQREIMVWLDSRRGFEKLIIHEPEHEDYSYDCIFTIKNIIYHSGHCVGFNVTATFDSLYQYKKNKVLKIEGDGTAKEYTLFNYSDNVDDYVYPKIEFTTNDTFEDDKRNISIINKTDSDTREFLFKGINNDTKVVVDNQLKVITGAGLDNFCDKKWLRLKKGKNILQVRINGTATITCPQYTKIRF